MTIFDDERAVLVKLAKKTKMDCWFSIRDGVNGTYVFDLENRKAISLKSALKDMVDGLVDTNMEFLDNEEKVVFLKLLADLIVCKRGRA